MIMNTFGPAIALVMATQAVNLEASGYWPTWDVQCTFLDAWDYYASSTR